VTVECILGLAGVIIISLKAHTHSRKNF